VIAAILLFAQVGVVQFQTNVTPDTVYVGEQVTYDAITLVDDVARTRLKANPVYTPPDIRGVTVYDFPFDTTAISTVYQNGMPFRRYVYRRALFALTPGTYTIPPASLSYSLPESDSYFSERGTFTAHSLPLTFVALPLPVNGRPMDFPGVVGQFVDTLYFDQAVTPRVGEPFTVTMRVNGVGNVTLLPRPPLRVDWADVVMGEERVTWDSTGSVVRGAKEFDWLVTPKVAGGLFIPSVRYDYFDPTTRQYAAAVTPVRPVTVVEAATSLPETMTEPRDTIGATPFPMLKRIVMDHPVPIAAGVLLVIFLIIFAAIRARSDPSGD
jgi:hypothetical protein